MLQSAIDDNYALKITQERTIHNLEVRHELQQAQSNDVALTNADLTARVKRLLHDAGRRQSCPGTVPETTNTASIPERPTADPELQDRVIDFASKAANAADDAIAFGQQCSEYALSLSAK